MTCEVHGLLNLFTQRMVLSVTEVYTDMVNAALFKDALEHLPKERIDKLGEWLPFTEDLHESCGPWLPLCVRRIRCVCSQLVEVLFMYFLYQSQFKVSLGD